MTELGQPPLAKLPYVPPRSMGSCSSERSMLYAVSLRVSLYFDSRAATAAKSQQVPHWPWSSIGEVKPNPLRV